jgi:hypothetical protein
MGLWLQQKKFNVNGIALHYVEIHLYNTHSGSACICIYMFLECTCFQITSVNTFWGEGVEVISPKTQPDDEEKEEQTHVRPTSNG